ncbi:hypothetical protein [Xanthomonas graminis]|uniref:hypothetical protein n=1 Tax=Xanthomonas graminis TaxID=3390026 RepID=UPI000AD5186E|nr:hypothetical protein [Xanthomonas translucens]WIH08214.1 hypothetical protein KM579_17535 [Xanthomonas translucens pv. graminis]
MARAPRLLGAPSRDAGDPAQGRRTRWDDAAERAAQRSTRPERKAGAATGLPHLRGGNIVRGAQCAGHAIRAAQAAVMSMDARRNRHNAVLGVVGNRSKHPSIDSIKPPSVSARKV